MGYSLKAFELNLDVQDYDLDVTLNSGQVFGWTRTGKSWWGHVQHHGMELSQSPGVIRARTWVSPGDWSWLRNFLQCDLELASILATFPAHDLHLSRAVQSCRGLRLLRQSPWECLASFILSATKQIVQIQQIHRLLGERFGTRLLMPDSAVVTFSFPTPERLAAASEAELRACKMGFRAPYLLAAARRVAAGEVDLEAIRNLELLAARNELLRFAGVGEKIADCVLLFAYGFPMAFPVDVWVRRVLVEYYFQGRQVAPAKLIEFAARHFGPQAGYAQQYLFHHVRMTHRKNLSAVTSAA